MNTRIKKIGLIPLAALLCLLLPDPASCTPILYLVTVDTSAVNGVSGFLEFGFAPRDDSQSAFVRIGGFSPLGGLSGTPEVNGGVSGALPGTLVIDNSTSFNDYFQAFNFESTITFLLQFDGPALGSPDGTSTTGSTFIFAMLDDTGTTPLLTTDPNGNAFIVDVNLDGTTTPTLFPPTPGGTPVVTLEEVSTPEPSALLLICTGLAMIGLCRGLQRRV
jgi:hypothetical protein